MSLSRREFCAMGAVSALVPLSSAAWAARKPSTGTMKVIPVTTTTDSYQSTLVNGYTPSPTAWNVRSWRPNMGSTWNSGMDHCLRLTQNKARFELRNTSKDHSENDSSASCRRSELSGSVYGDPTRLPNGVPLWGAMQFIHQHWDDPAGMGQLFGGVHGQIHMGSKLGGSPAVAFRRTKRGEFEITSRGERDGDIKGITRFVGPLSFDQVHNLVFFVVLHPTNGTLTVWLDGQKVVDVVGISLGSSFADSFWNIGSYYSGGITCPVVAEYANHVYPSTANLSSRITSSPAWPTW